MSAGRPNLIRPARYYYQSVLTIYRLDDYFGTARNAFRSKVDGLICRPLIFEFRPSRGAVTYMTAPRRRRAAAAGIDPILIVVHWDCQIRD